MNPLLSTSEALSTLSILYIMRHLTPKLVTQHAFNYLLDIWFVESNSCVFGSGFGTLEIVRNELVCD
jgi:hypothetical protein